MSFGGVGVRLSEARVNYMPTLKMAKQEKYVCKTCKHESVGYACTHPKNGSKMWEHMTQRGCWSSRVENTTAPKKKREKQIDIS